MSVDVTMPQLGESVVEGTVLKWLVHEGDRVTEDQPLVEISTDKVDTEIPSPAAGVIAKIVTAEGDTVPIGAQLAIIETAAAAAGAAKPAPAAAAASVVKAPAAPAAAKAADGANGVAAPAAQAQPARPEAVTVVRPVAPAAPQGAQQRYSPLVMKIAAEHGIDLGRVQGTGLGGRISKRDVLRYLESLSQQGAAEPSAPPGTPAAAAPIEPLEVPTSLTASKSGALFKPPIYQPREGDQIEAFSRRRKIIAEHMVFSKTHAPHVGIVAEVDMTRAAAFRDTHKEAFRAKEGFALTFLPLVAAAAVRALKEFPRVNASIVGDSLVIRKDINLGIAADSDEGLVVPVIRSADTMTVVGLAREIEKLRRKVAEKKITPDDLGGGSFTVSNPGREGNLFGFAIINQPQVAILRMGEVKKRPVVIEIDGADAIAIRTMMFMTVSYDHRVIDGVLGNRFLYRIARILEEAAFEL